MSWSFTKKETLKKAILPFSKFSLFQYWYDLYDKFYEKTTIF